MKHPKTVTAVLTVVILLFVVSAIGLVVVFSGLPNVAASKPEGALTSWLHPPCFARQGKILRRERLAGNHRKSLSLKADGVFGTHT